MLPSRVNHTRDNPQSRPLAHGRRPIQFGPVSLWPLPWARVIDFQWRGQAGNAELNRLHAEAFSHRVRGDDWESQLSRHSLGWVCARDGADLAGFVNVAWDGGVHAFILDTMVAAFARHRGIGTRLVAVAADQARDAGCEWLHVDFSGDLSGFYFDRCGFRPTNAGLIALPLRAS
jgi:GNAT superfamily N-acetyltransferase